VITIPDSGFNNTELRSSSTQLVARLAPLVRQPGLNISVNGYSDSAANEPVAARRAESVRGALAARGVPNTVFRSFGDESLLTSNATPAGRTENRRVEIVISGNPIGSHPLWDHPTTVTLK
jgi:outer membrane protein OmpA-like peptidoglycan-associated protein